MARVEWEIYGHGRLMAPGLRLHHYLAGGSRTLSQPEQQSFSPAVRYEVHEYDYHLGRRTIPQLSLAYWFLLSLYLPAWGALLVAWQRWKARLPGSAARSS
jgi:hypothetical protein